MAQAYRKMIDAIDCNPDVNNLGYETQDEFYVDGELGSPADLQEAIGLVLNEEDEV